MIRRRKKTTKKQVDICVPILSQILSFGPAHIRSLTSKDAL